VIYAGESFAIAVLEKLVHLPIRRLPRNEVFASVEIPDALVEAIDAATVPGWDAAGMTASRAFGDAWYDAKRSCVLLVPSIVTRIDRNVLINQEHADFARLVPKPPRRMVWDRRLFGRRP
jgi:RES domain-containing protein